MLTVRFGQLTVGGLSPPKIRSLAGCSQTHSRHTPVDDGRGNRRGRHGFTVTARILWTDVAVDKELGGLDIELLGDVFADTSTSSVQVLTKSLPH
jgi:hypothetical protein